MNYLNSLFLETNHQERHCSILNSLLHLNIISLENQDEMKRDIEAGCSGDPDVYYCRKPSNFELYSRDLWFDFSVV